MLKRDTLKMYSLPAKVKFCKKCVMSNQRPRITFNEEGVCSACTFAVHKREEIDWAEREEELRSLCDQHRKNDGSFDVIVPCSGGKDGSFVAHMLKEKYNMNPLTVTWAPHVATDIGRKNLTSFIDSGFTNIMGTANGKVHRELSRLAFEHLGDNFQPFIYGQTNFPLQVAVKYGISLIMYGENGEVEYGGSMENAYKPTRDIKDHDGHYFSGLPPEFWEKHGISKKDLYPYLAPKYEDIVKNKTEIHFLGYYEFWDPQENYYYCREHTGFSPNTERSEGTYSKYASLDDCLDGLHYYLSYIKFGIGRTTSDASHEVRDGKITREEAVALVRKFDGEFPKKYFQLTLDYLGISEQRFWEVIDTWRSEHLWLKNNSDEWSLKSTVFDKEGVSVE